MVRTSRIIFHVYDKRTGGQFQDFVMYYNSMNSFDLNKYVEFQASQIESLGYAVTGYDWETRYTEADIASAFEASPNYCMEPGFNKMPDMPRWGTPMPDPASQAPL